MSDDLGLSSMAISPKGNHGSRCQISGCRGAQEATWEHPNGYVFRLCLKHADIEAAGASTSELSEQANGAV